MRSRGTWAAAAAVVAVGLALGLVTATWAAAPAEAATVVGTFRHASGLCLENAAGGTAANTPTRLVACANGPDQQWSRYADGTIRVRGRCLDLRGGATAPATAVVMNSCTGGASQRWTLLADGRVVSNLAVRCLQPVNGATAATTPAVIATCSAAAVQRWALPAVSTAPTTTTTPPATTTTTPPVTTTTTTPPVTTTPPTTTTTPPAGRTMWDSDVTASGLARFTVSTYQQVGAPAPTLVTSPSTAGARAVQVTMPGGGNRNEILPDTPDFAEGDDLWFGYSFTLGPNFPTQTESWQLITQWKNDGTGSPPIELTVGHGSIWLSGGYGHPAGPRPFTTPITTADVGRRIDLVVHVVFSRDPGRGTVDVWRDGTQRLSGYHPAGGTLYPDSASATPTGSVVSYWKMGIYRDPAITEPATLFIERARLGSGYAAVAG